MRVAGIAAQIGPAVPIDIINRQWTDITEEFEAGMMRLAQAIIR